MGTPKAALDWHGSTLLHRAAALLGRAVGGPVVVVAAPGQPLPPLPAGVTVVRDPVEGRGPLQGIGTGLAAVSDAPVAFVCATDLPLLHPAFVRRVLAGLTDDVDVVLPVALGFPQPLAAAYRTALAPRVADLLAAGVRRPPELFARVRVLHLDESALLADPDLAAVDPALDSLLNVNDPDGYTAALARPAPSVQVGGVPMRIATLGAAGSGVRALNGGPVPPDPAFPLVAGDVLDLY